MKPIFYLLEDVFSRDDEHFNYQLYTLQYLIKIHAAKLATLIMECDKVPDILRHTDFILLGNVHATIKMLYYEHATRIR